MDGLGWRAVVLILVLSAGNSLAVDQNRLATLVNAILGQYGTSGMFSLAVRIPDNQNQNLNQILQPVLTSDPPANVRNVMNNNQVYVGGRVIAAKVLKRPGGGADHAESRVVDYLNHLFNSRNANDRDILLFYVFSSPCVEKCSSDTHRESILGRINAIRQWNDYAVVFSTIFRARSGYTNTEQERSAALQRLATYTYRGGPGPIGLNNIFRCDGPRGQKQCTSCSSGGQVDIYCVADLPSTSG